MLDDLAHERVPATLQDLDVPVLEAPLTERLDHLAGDLLVVEHADDGCCHLSLSNAGVGCRMDARGVERRADEPVSPGRHLLGQRLEPLHHRLLTP